MYRLIIIFSLLFLTGCTAAVATTAVVATNMATDRRTTGIYVEDEGIELKAAKAFSDDEQLSEQADVSAVSFNRIVLIYGQAPNQALKNKASTLVRKIDNVKKLHNEIRISAPTSFFSNSGDALLTSEVKIKLLAEEDLDSGHIKVVTENGEVFLMGMVTEKEAKKAIDVVRNIDGVERVVNVFEYIPESAVNND